MIYTKYQTKKGKDEKHFVFKQELKQLIFFKREIHLMSCFFNSPNYLKNRVHCHKCLLNSYAGMQCFISVLKFTYSGILGRKSGINYSYSGTCKFMLGVQECVSGILEYNLGMKCFHSGIHISNRGIIECKARMFQFFSGMNYFFSGFCQSISGVGGFKLGLFQCISGLGKSEYIQGLCAERVNCRSLTDLQKLSRPNTQNLNFTLK